MTATQVLHKELKQYIDKADDKSLRIVKSILEIELEEDESSLEAENWDDLPKELQMMIDQGIKDADEGKGTPHELIMEKYSKWFSK